jgi:hypothetical protein
VGVRAPVVDQHDAAGAERVRLRRAAEGDEIERLLLAQRGVAQPREVGHRHVARVGAEQDVDAVGTHHLERRAADRGQDRLGVERAADRLVDAGERTRLLVAQALEVERVRALDREAQLVAERVEKAQLVLGELQPRTAGDVEDTAARALEAQRDAGVGEGRREALHDVGHARALAGVAGLHPVAGREHLGAQALTEAALLHLAEIALRKTALRRETQLLLALVAEEDPRRPDLEPLQDLAERQVQDLLDVAQPVRLGADGREDRQLSVTALDGRLEIPEALGVRLLQPCDAVHSASHRSTLGCKSCAMVECMRNALSKRELSDGLSDLAGSERQSLREEARKCNSCARRFRAADSTPGSDATPSRG